jgi:hypothetical protein
MALKESIRGACPHCFGGTVFEPTDDPLEDEAMECPACLGTARRMPRTERLKIKDERDLDTYYSGLERMGGHQPPACV